MRSKRRAPRWSAFVLGAATLATGLGCADAPPDAPEPIRAVKMITLGEGAASGRREYPATLSPALDARLGFEVAGRIVAFPVTEGQAVDAGAVLARLDARDYEAKLRAVQASLRKAEADLARALAVRAEDAGAISMAMIDLYRRSVEVTRADLAVAEKALDDATLRAPFAGRIARTLVNDFANVQAKEAVVNLQDASFIHAVVDLPERDLLRPRAGHHGRLDREAATARFAPTVSIPSHPGHAYPASIWEFATTADPATRTFRLTLRFPAPSDVVLLPGMTGTAALTLVSAAGQDSTLRVPIEAVVTGADREPYVWIIEADTMTARPRPVRLGRIVSGDVEVLDGLRAGDTIATTGIQQLRAGMVVRRHEPSA